jgi:hypothetical protein
MPGLPEPVPGTISALPEGKYAYLDPERQVPRNLLLTALAYYDSHLKRIENHSFISIVDFTKNAFQKRLFIIDMKTGAVRALLVSHGEGSDPENTGKPTSFSNTPGSKQSSLGFYRTGGTYLGKFKLSMQLDGLSPSNSQARSRRIVVHGYEPVTERYAGPSWGCLAVAPSEIERVVAALKGGSIIYAGLSKDIPKPPSRPPLDLSAF